MRRFPCGDKVTYIKIVPAYPKLSDVSFILSEILILIILSQHVIFSASTLYISLFLISHVLKPLSIILLPIFQHLLTYILHGAESFLKS
jgi:hypothetical protein